MTDHVDTVFVYGYCKLKKCQSDLRFFILRIEEVEIKKPLLKAHFFHVSEQPKYHVIKCILKIGFRAALVSKLNYRKSNKFMPLTEISVFYRCLQGRH